MNRNPNDKPTDPSTQRDQTQGQGNADNEQTQRQSNAANDQSQQQGNAGKDPSRRPGETGKDKSQSPDDDNQMPGAERGSDPGKTQRKQDDRLGTDEDRLPQTPQDDLA